MLIIGYIKANSLVYEPYAARRRTYSISHHLGICHCPYGCNIYFPQSTVCAYPNEGHKEDGEIRRSHGG